MTQSSKITNYLTIDVEEHFQVAAFEDIVNPKDWEIYESRVVKNTNLILDLLKKHKTKATFFIVGWTAERHPDMVREIASQGHDIGCHSYMHKKIYDLTPEEFRQDTVKAKAILEQIIKKKGSLDIEPPATQSQKKHYGHSTFSTNWALNMIPAFSQFFMTIMAFRMPRGLDINIQTST